MCLPQFKAMTLNNMFLRNTSQGKINKMIVKEIASVLVKLHNSHFSLLAVFDGC